MTKYQVREGASPDSKVFAVLPEIPGGGVATSDFPGLIQPDNVTTAVNSSGILSALGGNLLLNSEAWITESGEWEAPVTGWYEILLIDGGQGGTVQQSVNVVYGGASGAYDLFLMYLGEGEEVPVVIGTGGKGYKGTGLQFGENGSRSSFGEQQTRFFTVFRNDGFSIASGKNHGSYGSGPGGGNTSNGTGLFYGAGGGAYHFYGDNTKSYAGDGSQGAVRLRWHDPVKAAGSH